MKVFNVWLIIEEIDEEKNDNGKDINCAKLYQCKTEKEADKRLHEIEEITSGGKINDLR